MFNDPLLKLMSVGLMSSEGTLPLIPYQHLQSFYHQHLVHQQPSHQAAHAAAAAAAAAMLVHNGRIPGGSPVPIPSPTSSLSHPESPRSQAGDASPPAAVEKSKERRYASKRKPSSDTEKMVKEEKDELEDKLEDAERGVLIEDEPGENDEVLSIGGKDDEQMMMDCDSSVSDNNPSVGGSVIKSETEEGGRSLSIRNNVNGHMSSDEEDDDDESIDKKNSSRTNRLVSCPSGSTTTTEEYEGDEDDNMTLPTSEPDTTTSSPNANTKRSKSHKNSHNDNNNKEDNHLDSQTARSASSNNVKQTNLHYPFNISSLSRHSPTDDLYSRHPLHHHIVGGGVPHPNNYFLHQHHNHFFHQQLINNHDTSSNHSTASSNNTNNSTSPSPSSAFANSFLQQHHHLHPHHQQLHQHQQQTAAVAAAHSLIFSIANILRPDFGLCNNNNTINSNQNGSSSKSPHKTSSSSHHNLQHSIAALHGFGVKRSSSGASGGGNNSSTSNDKVNHGHGFTSNPKQRQSVGHREPSAHRNSTTTPIDLSRPSSTGSSSATMISPTAMMSMMLERGGPISQTKSRQNHSKSHHKSDNHNSHQPIEKARKQHQQSLDKPERVVVTPSSVDGTGGVPQNGTAKSPTAKGNNDKESAGESGNKTLWPAWVYCTRYSDRPSSGPRTRRTRKAKDKEIDEKRPRTAFTAEQLSRLKKEFEENRYLTEKRRQDLARELKLHENQIKIWFQNKRAKLKKATGSRGGLAMQLMAQGLYNHSTVPRGPDDDSEEDDDDC